MEYDRRPVHNLELDTLTDYRLSPGDIYVISIKRDRRRGKYCWEDDRLIERALGSKAVS